MSKAWRKYGLQKISKAPYQKWIYQIVLDQHHSVFFCGKQPVRVVSSSSSFHSFFSFGTFNLLGNDAAKFFEWRK